jgi:hypothetical protein
MSGTVAHTLVDVLEKIGGHCSGDRGITRTMLVIALLGGASIRATAEQRSSRASAWRG